MPLFTRKLATPQRRFVLLWSSAIKGPRPRVTLMPVSLAKASRTSPPWLTSTMSPFGVAAARRTDAPTPL